MVCQWWVNGGSMEGQRVINGYSMGRGSMEGSMGGQWGVNDESMWVDNGLNGKYTNKAPKPPT